MEKDHFQVELKEELLKINKSLLNGNMKTNYQKTLSLLEENISLPISDGTNPLICTIISLLNTSDTSSHLISLIIRGILMHFFSENALIAITSNLKSKIRDLEITQAIQFLQKSPDLISNNFPDFYFIQSLLSICFGLLSHKESSISATTLACFQQIVSSISGEIQLFNEKSETYPQIYEQLRKHFGQHEKKLISEAQFTNPTVFILYILYDDLISMSLGQRMQWIQAFPLEKRIVFSLLQIAITASPETIKIIQTNKTICSLFEVASIQNSKDRGT